MPYISPLNEIFLYVDGEAELPVGKYHVRITDIVKPEDQTLPLLAFAENLTPPTLNF